MALKDLLVCIDRTAAGDARLKLAFNLARGNKAYLTGAHALPERPAASAGSVGFGVAPPAGMTGLADDGLSTGGADSEISRDAEFAETVEQRFKSELRRHSLDGEWHLLADDDTAALLDLAKTVDLTITGQRPPNAHANGAARFRPEDLVVAAGRPVLVVPYAGAFETVGKCALVAWDGTREANRALNDTLPLLADAEAVSVVFVGSRERDLDQHREALEREPSITCTSTGSRPIPKKPCAATSRYRTSCSHAPPISPPT